MPSIKNINELRENCLTMLDDIIGGTMVTMGDKEDSDVLTLEHYNKQVKNVIDICNIEMKYAQLNDKTKIKFFEYED